MLYNLRGMKEPSAIAEDPVKPTAEAVEKVVVRDKEEPLHQIPEANSQKKQDPSSQAEKAKTEEKAGKIEKIEDETDLDDLFDSVTELFEEKETDK